MTTTMTHDPTTRMTNEVDRPEREESTWAFLGFIWRRKAIVIFLVIVALGLGYLYFTRQDPEYQSSGRLLVVQKQHRLPVQGVGLKLGFDTTDQVLVRSDVIIPDAIAKYDLGSLPSLKGSSNPASTIANGITIRPITGESKNIIDFSYKGDNRNDCQKILVAIVDSYREYLTKSEKSTADKAIELITQANDQLDTELRKLAEEYSSFRYKAPLLYAGEEAANVHEQRLLAIEGVRSGLVLENSQLQAQIDGLSAARSREGVDRDALLRVIGAMSVDQTIRRTSDNPYITRIDNGEDQLFPLLMEEQLLLDKWGREHPHVLQVQKRIEVARKYIKEKETKAKAELEAEKKRREENQEPDIVAKDYIAIHIMSLQERININNKTLGEMDRLYDRERVEAKALEGFQVTDASLRKQIANKERLFNAVVGRLQEMQLTSDADAEGTVTEIIGHPGLGRQVAPDLNKILLTSGLLGLLAGLAVGYVVDSADKRFRSPEEIRDDFGLPVVGHIPVIPAEKKAWFKKAEEEGNTLDVSLKTVHNPRGRIAEAYRAVRTALYFSTRGRHKIIQITSPNPGDGKTTLISNLAITIANSGRRVLLIDADFRRPRVDKLFGADTSKGMSTVISGKDEIDDAVQQTEIANLSVLPCGPRPKNPAELITSTRFSELLNVLREKFEFVLVDTPPVGAVTDPLAIAPHVDATILVMRLTKNSRKFGRHALENLQDVGANVLGVVVNGVGNNPSYGYANYEYQYGADGYRLNYGYGYGYGYEDTENHGVEDMQVPVASHGGHPPQSPNGNGEPRGQQ